jgi:hypothetical protein
MATSIHILQVPGLSLRPLTEWRLLKSRVLQCLAKNNLAGHRSSQPMERGIKLTGCQLSTLVLSSY